MAENKKVYTIQINGVKESTDAIDSLNKTLNTLDTKIKELESKTVTVSSKGGSSSVLSEEAALQKEINNLKNEGAKLDAKIAATQSEVYQKVQATKDLYKEAVNDQKQLAAQERLTANAYSNTMAGMKQHLADLKTVINTTDLGDSDAIKKMTQEANELNDKLKEIEESYGQYGRSVGNYANGVAEGLQKVKINVGGTVREFSSAREASRTLNNELKAMAVNGDTTSDEFKQLREAVMQMESAMNDAKKPMDDIMDAMESFTAIASVSEGISALFGVDDSEIQRSIQKLVALQNAMQGLQTIQKQLHTGEGIGGWIKPFTASIDKGTTKLLIFNRALLGTGTAGKVAAKGIKLASTALKGLVSLGIIAVISVAIEKVMDLVESFNKLSDAKQAQKNVEEEMAKAYGEGVAKLTHYKNKLDDFNGSKKQEKKLVEELNNEFGTTLGTYKSVSEWQDVMKKKSEAYIKTLTLQAKAQALVNELTAAYGKLAQIDFKKASGDYDSLWNKWFGKSYDAEKTEINNLISFITTSLESVDKEIEQHNKDNKLGNYAPQIEKNTDKTKKALEEEQRILNQLQVRLMQDGLNKKLRQLDEEERQTINKLKENGRKTGNAIQQIERSYATLRFKEINDYIKKLEISIRQAADNISNVEFGIKDTKLKNQIAELQNMFEQMSNDQPIRNTLKSYSETQEVKKLYKVDDTKIEFARSYENLFRISEATKKADEYYKFLSNYVKDKDKQLFQDISDYSEAIYKETDEERNAVYMKGLEDTFKKVEAIVEKEYANELLYIRNYTQNVNQTLTESFSYRLNSEKEYDKHYRQELLKNIAEQGKLNNVIINNAADAATEAEEKRYQAAQLPLENMKTALEEEIKNFKARNDSEGKSLEELKNELKVINDQMEQQRQQHYTKLVQITDDTNNKLKKNTIDTANQISAEQQKTFDNQITNLRDAQSKINEIMSKQPVYNKLGVVDVSKTKKQYKEIEDAANAMIFEIITQQALLNAAFSKGLIKPEAMNAIKSQLNDLMAEFKKMSVSIKQESDDVIPKFIESIQPYIQAVGQAANQILSSLSEIASNQYEAQIEEQEKYIEKYEELLDKQKEATQKYADEVNSIEDELKTARGDRRQQLIDNLNAQMAAERASLAQEKKIEKEKEKAEERKKKLEHDQAVAKKKMDLAQAYINAAMAVSMAAVNKWPIPAIPMMALAAAAGAAQIAAVASQNIPSYGDGGVIQGKSHAQGGVKVLGGRAEVEGGEFITNKVTTQNNVELLDFVNSKKKRLNLSDFIEFYGGGHIKKNIENVKTKFADGGIIPTLRSDITFNDRLLQSFEDYSNRPVTVSVVEINDKQAAVRNVQVLSGLEN